MQMKILMRTINKRRTSIGFSAYGKRRLTKSASPDDSDIKSFSVISDVFINYSKDFS